MRLSILAAAILAIPPLATQAGESMQATGRTVSYRTAAEVLERDAANKPIKGTIERVGITLHEAGPASGTYSQVRIVATWRLAGKSGVYSGTLHRTFDEGEIQDIAFKGRFGKGRAEGTYECVGGTGKYANATCRGTYTSTSFPNGMASNRWSGTIRFAK